MPRGPLPELRAPDAVYARARWIPEHQVEWATHASEIIREHGSVVAERSYEKRTAARWHCRSLIRLLVELRLFEREELAERTSRVRDGRYVWAVEFAKPYREG